MSVNKRPVFFTSAEARWFERTPKRTIFAIMRDYAAQEISFDVAQGEPKKVLEEIIDRQKIVVNAGYDNQSSEHTG